MNKEIIGVLGVVVVFALIFLIRLPVAMSFAIVGFAGLVMVRGWKAGLNVIGSVPFDTMMTYVWTVFPMFVLMGFLSLHSRLAEDFYSGVRSWIGHFRGGLAHAVILGNTGFGACVGDPISAVVTFTTMSLPEMRKYNYNDELTLGAIGAGGLLASLIPPSLGLIIYGALTEESIGQLFMAGIIPGLIYAVACMVLIYIMCRRNPTLGPAAPKATWAERWSNSTGMFALLIVFIVIIGGIFLGLFTPTEAGGFGAFTVLIIGLARRRFSWKALKDSGIQASLTVGMVMLLLIGTMMFNVFLVTTELPQTVARFLTGLTKSPIGLIWVIIVAYIILGSAMDTLALNLLMIPILYPVIRSYGIDGVQFGIIMLLAGATGGFTPPDSIIVYSISGIVKDVSIPRIFKGMAPFLICIMVVEALVVFIPQITLFLPTVMIRR